MRRQPTKRLTLFAAMLVSGGCSSEPPTGPGQPTNENPPASVTVASVTVTSPLDSILARGSSVQLDATVLDIGGNPVTSPALEWSSTDTDVITVASAGSASAMGPGAATVTATVVGTAVDGTLRLVVVDADLEAISAVTANPFAEALVDAVSAPTGSTTRQLWEDCAAAAAESHIVHLLECVEMVRTHAAGAVDPTDLRLLTTLSLMTDHIERSLDL